MKALSLMKMALLLAIPLIMASCRSHQVVQSSGNLTIDSTYAELYLKSDSLAIKSNSALCICSKLKFTVAVGDQNLSLTGNLRMRRNEVIRLQLMAFGFVEAARIEFTPEYVLFIDRINKQYLMAPYHYIDFLRNSDINFYTLQSLFWNELFAPGGQDITDEKVKARFTTEDAGEGETIIHYQEEQAEGLKNRMFYSWLVNSETGRVRMANILYRDDDKGPSSLNWDYREFKSLGTKLFPSNMQITLALPKKEVQLGIKLNYLNNDEDWEIHTRVSDKYREVDFDAILSRFLAL